MTIQPPMIAICIGHSRPGDSGAVSVGGISEHAYNSRVGTRLVSILTARGVACALISTYQGGSYLKAMKWLGGYLATLKASAAIELHFNASDNPQAGGHEWFHWSTSTRGRDLARALDAQMSRAFPTLRARGVQGIIQKDRGGEFCRATPCPAALCEPFFGSNPTEWQLLASHEDRYAQVLADALCAWIGGRA